MLSDDMNTFESFLNLFTDTHTNSFMEMNLVNTNLPCKVYIRDEDPETSLKTAFRKLDSH